jgi:hypothetical protein
MTTAPEPNAEPADDRYRETHLHPRDNRVLRDHHGNPLPGTDQPDHPDDPPPST